MGLVYLFSLVVGLGILAVQVAMGGKEGSHGGDGDHGGHDHAGDGHEIESCADDMPAHADAGSKDFDKELSVDAEAGAFTLFLSTRFWIFASLAFGMSGSLIHYFGFAGTIATAIIAASAGFASGLFAVLAFRALKRASSNTSSHTGEAVGQVGRVLVSLDPKKKGQIRVELRGHSVDMLATTDDEAIARGEPILVEDVRDGVAHVSRRPRELE